MVFFFALCGITGIIKLPVFDDIDLQLLNILSYIHDWTGIFCVVLISIHFILHKKWFAKYLRSIFTKPSYMKCIVLFIMIFMANSAHLWAGGEAEIIHTIPKGVDYNEVMLIDGVYKGSANGYKPALQVEVTVKNNSIQSITIIQHNESKRWFKPVIKITPQEIINSNSTQIDIVSGATSSSYGIMSAVENALENAVENNPEM